MQKKIISSGEKSATVIVAEMSELISKIPSANPDYIKIVEADTFEIVDDLKSGEEYYILIACKIGKTRLIDNTKIKM